MPDILERLEKFSVYSAGEQREVLDYAISEVRNNRHTMELMGREIERLEALISLPVEEDTSNDHTLVADIPVVPSVLDEGPHESVGLITTATALDNGGDVVRDMPPEEIARVFGSGQVIEEPTVDEVNELREGLKITSADLDGVTTEKKEVLYGGAAGTITTETEAEATSTERQEAQRDTASDSDTELGQVGEPAGGGFVSEPRGDAEGAR